MTTTAPPAPTTTAASTDPRPQPVTTVTARVHPTAFGQALRLLAAATRPADVHTLTLTAFPADDVSVSALQLTAVDLTTTATVNIPATVTAPGLIELDPAALRVGLARYSRSRDVRQITVTATTDRGLAIGVVPSGAPGWFGVQRLDHAWRAEPVGPRQDSPTLLTVDGVRVLPAIAERVATATASEDDASAALAAVHLTADNGTFTAAATDAYRIHTLEFPGTAAPAVRAASLPMGRRVVRAAVLAIGWLQATAAAVWAAPVVDDYDQAVITVGTDDPDHADAGLPGTAVFRNRTPRFTTPTGTPKLALHEQVRQLDQSTTRTVHIGLSDVDEFLATLDFLEQLQRPNGGRPRIGDPNPTVWLATTAHHLYAGIRLQRPYRFSPRGLIRQQPGTVFAQDDSPSLYTGALWYELPGTVKEPDGITVLLSLARLRGLVTAAAGLSQLTLRRNREPIHLTTHDGWQGCLMPFRELEGTELRPYPAGACIPSMGSDSPEFWPVARGREAANGQPPEAG